ncbi:hypothetical protein KORDIASMS9_03729 [Kordia sp. SMS9]|uniref:hypothetical protein n=1 Tax=Kordia sp. SMS9 TaxID=2282170 RepID=UPI000E10DFAC|nr:hypothetical protein [Kordia sp. SMS9]AXG71472.1 hypothetical protein KORDIASMS9_03729 [Kordia sp. SMS9]
MKKIHVHLLKLNKVAISNVQARQIQGGLPVQNNYTRANCERSSPASICHCR